MDGGRGQGEKRVGLEGGRNRERGGERAGHTQRGQGQRRGGLEGRRD